MSVGDGDGDVTIDDLALGVPSRSTGVSECEGFDPDGSATETVGES
jgi:hypothetical protein